MVNVPGDRPLGHPDETKKRGKGCCKGVLSVISEGLVVYNGVEINIFAGRKLAGWSCSRTQFHCGTALARCLQLPFVARIEGRKPTRLSVGFEHWNIRI